MSVRAKAHLKYDLGRAKFENTLGSLKNVAFPTLNFHKEWLSLHSLQHKRVTTCRTLNAKDSVTSR